MTIKSMFMMLKTIIFSTSAKGAPHSLCLLIGPLMDPISEQFQGHTNSYSSLAKMENKIQVELKIPKVTNGNLILLSLDGW